MTTPGTSETLTALPASGKNGEESARGLASSTFPAAGGLPFGDNLPVSSVKLRGYQARVVRRLIRTKRGIVKAPAGSGKTIMASAGLDRVLRAKPRQRKCRVLWIANTRDQLEQAQEALALFPSIAILAEVDCFCPSGVPVGYPLAEVDLLIVDECHHASAATWAKVIKGCTRSARWGFSATPCREDDEEMAQRVFRLLGPICEEVKRGELVEQGSLARARVLWHECGEADRLKEQVDRLAQPEFARRWAKMPAYLRNEEKERETLNRCRYQMLAQSVEADEQAFAKIVALANAEREAGKSVLILCRTVDYGKQLAGALARDDFEQQRMVLHAKVGKKLRREIVEGMRDGSLPVVCATSIADEGLDAPRLATLIMAAPGKSRRLAEQRTGRVLRKFAGKREGIIHEFAGEAHPMLRAQARKRGRTYKELGYRQVKGGPG